MGAGQSLFSESFPTDYSPDHVFYRFDNLGNTCYCNCILQALFNSQYFLEYIDDFRAKLEEHSSHTFPSKSPFFQFLRIVAKPYKDSESRIHPKSFLRAVRRETTQFPKGIQHDAHEFLVFLFDSFDRSIAQFNKEAGETVFQPFSSIFEGEKLVKMTCDACQNVEESTDTFLTYGLIVRDGATIEDMIAQSLEAEHLGDSELRDCDHCKTKQASTVEYSIKKVPKVLVIEFNRFVYSNGRMVRTKDWAQIANQICINQIEYNLKTVIIHEWNRGSGHYRALLYVDGRWINASDSNLNLMKLHQEHDFFGPYAMNRQNQPVPYLLFYEQKDSVA